ncbi:hypothetical protein G9A89_022701 [Geosiphon pyriformis]|nr:hypothetical protein G9A89_022701 [Geosiphon pyriformis]
MSCKITSGSLSGFFTHEFDAIVIPPFGVSEMVIRKTKKITRKTVRKMTSSDQQGRAMKSLLLSRTKFTHPRLVVNVATSKES